MIWINTPPALLSRTWGGSEYEGTISMTRRRYDELVRAEKDLKRAQADLNWTRMLANLRAKVRDNVVAKLAKQREEINELKEENNDLRDLLKQAIGHYRPSAIERNRWTSVGFRLGSRPDLRVKITKGQADGEWRRVSVTRPEPEPEPTKAAEPAEADGRVSPAAFATAAAQSIFPSSVSLDAAHANAGRIAAIEALVEAGRPLITRATAVDIVDTLARKGKRIA